jgi:hypothetical protein
MQETPKNIEISKNASDTKEEGSKDTLCLFMRILELRPEISGFSAQSANCGHTKNALMAVPH